jgi:pyrroline-5-carboxylate reductase
MPNMPCQIGAGMAAIAVGEGAQPGDETLAVGIFEALGRTVIVDEAVMHAVTAVSGSGPAYVFLLAEAMEQAGVGLGLDPDTARLLVRQTILGAGKLLAESDRTASELRVAVTSPGGTTEAALTEMLSRELPTIVQDAVTAARDRGAELESL